MRIDLYNSTAAAEATNQSGKVSADNSVAFKHQAVAPTEDTTSLSSSSDTVQSLAQTALQSAPARTAKLESLKQAVNSGQYQLDPAKIADALSSSDL